jgi:O-antigen ligase
MYAPHPTIDQKIEQPNLPVVLAAIWIVSAAVFGANFYALRFAGFLDITIERLIFLPIILLLLSGMFSGKVDLQKNNTIEIFMGMFVLVCLISMTITGFLPSAPQFPSPWFVFISGYLFPFMIFIFAKSYIVNERHVLFILHTLFFFGIYLCLTSFLEFADLRQFVFPRYIADLSIGIHIERARGPFLNAPFNGVAILAGFICGLHLLQKKEGFKRFFYQAALLLFFPAVFFTLTRAIYLAMLATVIIFLGWYKTPFPKWKMIALPLAIVLVVGLANAPRLLSTDRRAGGVYQVVEVDIRAALLERSALLFSEKPFVGVGLAQFIPASSQTYRGKTPYVIETAGTQFQHNHLLGIATEMGIPGILLYLAIVIHILRRFKQLAGKLPEAGIMGNNLLVVIVSIWCVYLINNLFVEPSNNLFVNVIPFLFAGLADGLYVRSLQPDVTSQVFMSRSPMRIMRSHV